MTIAQNRLGGFPCATEKAGQLNPAHSRWLMAYPAAWDACAPYGNAIVPELAATFARSVLDCLGR